MAAIRVAAMKLSARCRVLALFMKKPVRLLLLATGLGALVTGGLVGLAFHSGVQTWAARKALAGQPTLKASLGQLSAGFRTVELHDLHFERDGARIALPAVLTEVSTIDAGLNRKVLVKRLIAKGWTLDLTGYRPPTSSSAQTGGAAPASAPVTAPTAVAAAPAAAAAQVFQGIFAQTALPFDLALDGVDLEGDVKLSPAPGIATGSAHVVLRGGGLATGQEGAFTFDVVVALTGNDVPVTSLKVTGRLAAAMDTPRTFYRLATTAEAAATGPRFPSGVKLAAEVAARREAAGESYAISLSDSARLLASLQAALPSSSPRLAGSWKLDLRDTDLAPFTLGRALPSFGLVGVGGLEVDTASAEVHTTGKLNVSADRLGVIQPELAVIGLARVNAEFDLARRGDNLRVERVTAAVSGSGPVATVQSLQPFEFNARTGELKVAAPDRDLLSLALQGLPLGWAQPFLKDTVLTGGNVRGELVAVARNGGFSLRAKTPLAADGVSLAQAGKPMLRAVDLSATAAVDYTPQGWQVELAPLTLKSGAATLLALDAKVGQLTGANQPVKATGKFSSTLPAALAQPVAGGALALTGGEAAGEFVVSLGAKQEIQGRLALTQLAVDPKLAKEKLPALDAEVRAEIASTGAITLNVPLVITAGDRKSDLTLSGTVTPGKTATAIDAHVTGNVFVIDDAQAFAVVLPLAAPVPEKSPTASAAPAMSSAPLWAGFTGQLALALKKVVYSDSLQLSEVTGTLSLEAGSAKIVNFRAGLGGGASAKLDGRVTYDIGSSKPYAIAAEVALDEFDPVPLFKTINPGQPATVEGRFSLASKVTSCAPTLAECASAATGEFQLTSRGGIFRGLPVSYAAKAESTGRIAAGVAAVSSVFSSVTSSVMGRKDLDEIASKAQAVSEMAQTLTAIPYDQLSVVFTRDAALNTSLKDFSLIAPELRLSGAGQATHREGARLLEDALTMEFKLRARGRLAEVLKYLGRLEPATDDLGYAGCTLPLKVAGTLGKPDTTQLNGALATLALEKSGVTEKASELFNKLIGGGK